MDMAVLIGPVASALMAFAGSYLAFAQRIARLEAKVDTLSERVDRHNSTIERTYKLETEVENLYHRYAEVHGEIGRMKEGGAA